MPTWNFWEDNKSYFINHLFFLFKVCWIIAQREVIWGETKNWALLKYNFVEVCHTEIFERITEKFSFFLEVLNPKSIYIKGFLLILSFYYTSISPEPPLWFR